MKPNLDFTTMIKSTRKNRRAYLLKLLFVPKETPLAGLSLGQSALFFTRAESRADKFRKLGGFRFFEYYFLNKVLPF